MSYHTSLASLCSSSTSQPSVASVGRSGQQQQRPAPAHSGTRHQTPTPIADAGTRGIVSSSTYPPFHPAHLDRLLLRLKLRRWCVRFSKGSPAEPALAAFIAILLLSLLRPSTIHCSHPLGPLTLSLYSYVLLATPPYNSYCHSPRVLLPPPLLPPLPLRFCLFDVFTPSKGPHRSVHSLFLSVSPQFVIRR